MSLTLAFDGEGVFFECLLRRGGVYSEALADAQGSVREYVALVKENMPLQRLMVAGAGCK